MIEIVFGESACGSLKIAQTYGKGKYRGSAVSVFMRHEDGSVPSSDEMKEAQIQAQEQEHIAWENAIPLGGKSSDVYCFDMALSVGDISDNGIGEQRKNVLKKMLSVWFVEDLDYQVEEKIQKIKTTLSSVIERYVAGEEVRIWYSYNPDELCGMYWLMKQLRPLNCQTTIYLVKLPAWEYGKENTMTSKIAWGEVSPGEWGKYITLQEKPNPDFFKAGMGQAKIINSFAFYVGDSVVADVLGSINSGLKPCYFNWKKNKSQRTASINNLFTFEKYDELKDFIKKEGEYNPEIISKLELGVHKNEW